MNRYFRAGVGTVIYNESGNVAFFERVQYPVGVWQFQQGGIDDGEVPEQTLWRELMEEVGLKRENFDECTEVPGWFAYEEQDAKEDLTKPRMGQVHRWYFLKIKSGVSIDLARATDQEFGDFKWISFLEAISTASPHKRSIYQQLFDFYTTHIEKTSR